MLLVAKIVWRRMAGRLMDNENDAIRIGCRLAVVRIPTKPQLE
jgi:hypothetical protein